MGENAGMVQGRNESLWHRAKDRIKAVLQGPQAPEAEIEFSLDLDNQGRHVTEAFIVTPEGKAKLSDPRELWDYGSSITIQGKQYAVSRRSVETLLSIRSMNPDVLPDGRLAFDVCPPVLKYLRSKKEVEEKPVSKQLKVSDTPPPRAAEIDFDPGHGIMSEQDTRIQ